MLGILITIGLLTVLQLVLCKFSLWWIICLICRLLFCGRAIGATFKVKNLFTGECVAIASMWLFNILFSGDNFPWKRFLFFIGISLVTCLIEFIDDIMNVYVIEDAEDWE